MSLTTYQLKTCIFTALQGAFLIIGLLYGAVAPVFAQSLFNDNVDGVLQNTNKKLDENTKKSPSSDYLPGLKLDEDLAVPQEGLSQVADIYVSRVVFPGAHQFVAEDFRPCYSPLLKRKVSEAQLVALSLCVTHIYRAAGYSLSRAIVPPQDVAGGLLKIQVIEGYIGSYRVYGDDERRFPTARFLDVLTAERPLRQRTLERQLLLLSDVAGLAVEDTALEEKGALSGAFELSVYVKSSRFISTSELDNRGSDAIGPLQSYNSLYINSLFGRGASLGLSYSSVPDEGDALNFGRISLDVPLRWQGLYLSAFLAASETRPSDVREYDDTAYKSLLGEVMLNWAALRSQERSLYLGFGVFASTNVREDDDGRFVRDEIRGLTLTGTLLFKDRFSGQSSLYGSLRQGLDVAGASRAGDDLLSRADGDGVFTKLYLDYRRYQALDKHWSFQIDAAVQVASEGLLSSEEFYIGGYRFGRGFESGLIGGDSGFGTSLEIAYTKPLDWRLIKSAQLYGFIDAASIFDDGSAFANGIFLSSAGGGLRLELDYGFEAEVEVGFPIEKDILGFVDDSQVYFRLRRALHSNQFGLDALLENTPLAERR